MPIDYDPLLAKLWRCGRERATAIARMLRALGEYDVGGIKTNLGFFRRILETLTSSPDAWTPASSTGCWQPPSDSGKRYRNGMAEDRRRFRCAVCRHGATRRMGRTGCRGPAQRNDLTHPAWKRTARTEGVGGE